MTLTVGHQHHAELLPHVDALRETADRLPQLDQAAVRARLDDELSFVANHLVPHMEMAERSLYPELDRLLADPRAMAPMRREHGELRDLVDALDGIRARLSVGPLPVGDELVLRRLLYRAFALIRVHLFEEERYLAILDRRETEGELASMATAMEHPVLPKM